MELAEKYIITNLKSTVDNISKSSAKSPPLKKKH